MGIGAELRPAFRFLYRAELTGEEPLVEHELDHVFVGRFDGEPRPEPAEVSDWRWTEADALRADLAVRPEAYTPWFRMLVEEGEWPEDGGSGPVASGQ